MKKSTHKSEFKFTLTHLVRLLIFFAVIALAILYLSSQSPQNFPIDSTVLGDSTSVPNRALAPALDYLWSQVPPSSRESLENLSNLPIIKNTESTLSNLQQEIPDYIQAQIKEIKKTIVKNIADDIIRSIEEQ